MKRSAVVVLSLAIFSLFFGAGNLILPPLLGAEAGELWWLVCLGFCLSAVLIPMLGILGYARIQGGMFDFAHKVSPAFSLGYCFLIYAVAISLPAPRTASVTHEMAVAPYLEVPSVLSSLLYFALVYMLVFNRTRLIGLIGKWLTPIILAVLLLLIGSIVLGQEAALTSSTLAHPFSDGFLEGYQTFDAIGAVIVGGVVLVSLNLEYPTLGAADRFRAVSTAGWLAGAALALLYAGLMVSGAMAQSTIGIDESRTGFLGGVSELALGPEGRLLLSLLIGLACFTTAVGIVAGTADFVKSRFGESLLVYRLTALTACVLGVLMGQLPVDYIIAVALPVLMLVYPLTIVLIILNALPARLAPRPIFRLLVAVVLISSIPDLLQSMGVPAYWDWLGSWPLQAYRMGWLIPALLAYGAGMAYHLWQKQKTG